MRHELMKELLELSAAERIQLVGDLWDSIELESLPPLTTAQLDEIDQELAEHRAHPDEALPWEQVKEWLWSRRK